MASGLRLLRTNRDSRSCTFRPSRPGNRRRSGALAVRWRRDGRELFYMSFDGRIHAVPVRLGPQPVIGAATPLFSARRRCQRGVPRDFRVRRFGRRPAIRDPGCRSVRPCSPDSGCAELGSGPSKRSRIVADGYASTSTGGRDKVAPAGKKRTRPGSAETATRAPGGKARSAGARASRIRPFAVSIR